MLFNILEDLLNVSRSKELFSEVLFTALFRCPQCGSGEEAFKETCNSLLRANCAFIQKQVSQEIFSFKNYTSALFFIV